MIGAREKLKLIKNICTVSTVKLFMNFKFPAVVPTLGDQAGKETKSGAVFAVRLLRRLHSQWAASSAFFATVLASLASAAAVISSDLPLLRGGL